MLEGDPSDSSAVASELTSALALGSSCDTAARIAWSESSSSSVLVFAPALRTMICGAEAAGATPCWLSPRVLLGLLALYDEDGCRAGVHRWAAGERRETSLQKRRQPGRHEVAKHLLEDRLSLGNSLLRSIGADKRDGLLHELIKLPAGVDAADERFVGGSGRRRRRRARFEGLAEPPEEGRRFGEGQLTFC